MSRPPIPFLAVLLLALACAPGGARADEDDGAGDTTLLLEGPKVLASPDTPRGLTEMLPGNGTPDRLSWPLPEGPVVVLGLPETDTVAQQIADAFDIDTDDLDGGYRVVAWRTEERPLVVVMGADPAALFAARFEFETAADMAMASPNMRSLDFKKPDQEAGVAVRGGTRVVRPRHAYRGWAPFGADDRAHVTPEIILEAAGSRLNRLWFGVHDLERPDAAARVALARRHGVTPVAFAAFPRPDLPEAQREGASTDAVGSLRQACERHGLRHAALWFPRSPVAPRRHDARHIERWAKYARLQLRQLEPTVVEVLHAIESGGSPDAILPHVPELPETLRGWFGPRFGDGIARADARPLVGMKQPPLVLMDAWAAPFQDPDVPYVPTLPRQGEARLVSVLHGVVVIGRRGTEALRESLWSPVEPRHGMGLLREILAGADEMQAADWPAATARALQEADAENLGLVPWIAPLAGELVTALEAADPAHVLLARHRGDVGPDAVDGRLDDALWEGTEPTLRLPGDAALTVVPSEAGLSIGVRVPRATLDARALLLRLSLRRPGAPHGVGIELTTEGWHVTGSLGTGLEVHEGAVVVDAAGLTAELVLDRAILGGDAHPARAFAFRVRQGPLAVWPEAGDTWGALVLRD